MIDFTTTAEIITETGHLTREAWLEYRKQGIGGSDCATVMGLSPFATARDLYNNKVGDKPAIDNDNDNWIQKEYGNLLEPLVAKIFSKKTGLETFQIHKMFRHPVHEFMLADVDYFVKLPDGEIALLECKTGTPHLKDKWDNGAVPINYEMQCRHYMSVLNINKTFIAFLSGNSENDFLYRVIERDFDYESSIIEELEYFWNEHVLKKTPPEYTENGDLVLKSIRNYFGQNKKESIVLNVSDYKQILEFLALKDEKAEMDHQIKKLEDRLKKHQALILESMGNGISGTYNAANNCFEVNNKPSYRTLIDKDNLEKLKAHYPKVYGEYVTTSESRRFSIKVKEAK